MSALLTQTVGRARRFSSGFTAGQRSVVVVAVIAIVLAAIALTRWMSQPTWTPLYGNLSGEDANAIVEELKSQGVRYQLSDGGQTVLVPQPQVYDLRVSMSGKGLPAGTGEGGYALLDQQGITATDFQQNVAYRRALEGELSKTLMAMDGVKTAVVHLALPKKDIFAEEEDKPTASVLLALRPGVELERDGVQAITRLVAGSVEGLDPAEVTVTDSAGRMLSTSTSGAAGSAAAANETDEQTAKYETRKSSEVQRVLDRVVGAGHSVVRVNAQLNFDTIDRTSESFLPPRRGVPPASESTSSERFTGNGGGVGGPLGQTLPDLTTGNETGGRYAKEQRTVNNSVGKVVERTQGAPGDVERLTVAVVLDTKTAGAIDPVQVQQIVANAVGLDPRRGDSVQVDTLPFDTTSAEAAAKEIQEAEKAAERAGYIATGKQVVLWLLGALVLLVLFRRRRKKETATVEAMATNLPAAEGVVIPAGATPESVEAGLLAALPAAEPPVVDHDRVREEVAALVDSQPDDVAAMLQGWLDERKA